MAQMFVMGAVVAIETTFKLFYLAEVLLFFPTVHRRVAMMTTLSRMYHLEPLKTWPQLFQVSYLYSNNMYVLTRQFN